MRPPKPPLRRLRSSNMAREMCGMYASSNRRTAAASFTAVTSRFSISVHLASKSARREERGVRACMRSKMASGMACIAGSTRDTVYRKRRSYGGVGWAGKAYVQDGPPG